MFGGKRAFSVGDLLTIDVAESSSLAASQNSVRNRQLQVENAVTQFLYANSKLGTTMVGCPALKLRPKVATRGGSIANTQDLKGRVSVIVIDVLPNGVLVLEGARMVTFSGETYYAVLKGMVRQEDIGFGFKDGLPLTEILFLLSLLLMPKSSLYLKVVWMMLKRSRGIRNYPLSSTHFDLMITRFSIVFILLATCVCYGARIKDLQMYEVLGVINCSVMV